MKITLLYIGRQLTGDYAQRIGRFCDFRMQEIRGDAALDKHDPAGRQMTAPFGRGSVTVSEPRPEGAALKICSP